MNVLYRITIAIGISGGILCAGWIAWRIVYGIGHRFRVAESVISVVASTLFSAFIILAVVAGLGIAGIDVTAVIASLGLTGFALGFALKDALSNMLAGVLLMIYRPFRRGDHIHVSGLEGRVSSINLRYTTLQSEDRKIFIPNANLFTNPVILFKKEEEKKSKSTAKAA